MKKCVILAVLAAFGITFAQSFGVRAGLNLAELEYGRNYSYSENGYTRERISNMTYSTGNLIGFHVGTVVDVGINEFLYIQPGVMLALKGGEIKNEYEERGPSKYEYEKEKTTVSTYYIDIPVMLSLKGKLNDNLALRVQAGPYIGFGLFGNMKEEQKEEYNGERRSEKREIEDIFSPSSKEKDEQEFDGFNRFNAGISFGGGVEFSGFYVGLSYNYGLTNLYKEEDNVEMYERTLGVTFGYNF